jgi:hypothetical protein
LEPDAPPTIAAQAGGPTAGRLPNDDKDATVTAAWEEPAPVSVDAAAMEAERPATAIKSFGYDGDDGGLPATSSSNVFSSLGQMFGKQNNDKAMDDTMDDGNVGNMFVSLYRQTTTPTIEPTKEEATIKMEDKDYATKKRPSRVTKKKVSYCEDSELEFDEDSYEQSKTKSFKKMVKATNSDSDSVEFELGPEADTSDRDEEADTVHSEIESENVDPIAVVFDEKDEVATKPSTDAKSSAVSKSLTDKEKRATNKKMKKEVLQNIPQFKAVLSVPFAFGPEHWKVLLSQMENGGDYTSQLFFGQSRVSQDWRAQTLVKARAKLGIGIIQVREGGRALGGSSDMRECVNPGEHCDGDHCFHRLMLISNSIYFCFPMDHTTNQCLSVSRKRARDWNITLAQREYVCGN